jgi:hypothetical protein
MVTVIFGTYKLNRKVKTVVEQIGMEKLEGKNDEICV